MAIGGAVNPLQATAERLVTVGPGPVTPPAGVAIGLRGVSAQSSRPGPAGIAGYRAPAAPDAVSPPMTLDTAHDLASVTKVVATTTALIRLVSEHMIRLDDPVAGFLPGFTGGGKETVTVRQLLLHRGGLWEWQPLYVASPPDPWTYLERLPLRYRPDSARHYSDLGFMLLGRIIEVVTGRRLDAAVEQLVTVPLGLTATRYGHPTAGGSNPDVAASAFGDAAEREMVRTGVPYPVLAGAEFSAWRDTPIAGEVNDGNAFRVFDGVSGHAGLFGDLADLLTFGTVLAGYRDRVDLWRPEVVAEFLAPGPDAGQSLGFRSWDWEGATLYGHPGFVGCTVGFSPEAGVALALCANRLLTPGTPMRHDDLWAAARDAATAALILSPTTTQ